MIAHSYGVVPVKPGGMEPQYLIVQHQSGHWGFPRTQAAPAEMATAAAKRALFEQTNIRDCLLNDQVFFTEQYQTTQDGQIVFTENKYYLGICHDTSMTKAQGQIARLRWVTHGEALDILVFQTIKDVLEHTHRYLQTNDQNQWM